MNKRLTIRFAGAGLFAACIAVGALAAPASAGQYWSNGPTGYVVQPTGICRYYNAWNRLDAQASPPSIYAPNRFAGSGNDAAWTRYQVVVVDRYGGFVQASTPSGWAASYDNQPATFSGAPVTFTNIPEFSTVHLYVEWVGAGYSSSALIRLDRHILYSGGSGPYGPVDSCSKWTI